MSDGRVIEHSAYHSLHLNCLFSPNIWYFLYSEMKNWVSLNLQTLWLYEQSYVLCCSAWINFITCCLFLNRHSWTSELTLVFSASLVHCCIRLQLKVLLAMCVWFWSQLSCWCHLKAIRQQNCHYSRSLACITLLQQNQSLLLTLLSKSASLEMRNVSISDRIGN